MANTSSPSNDANRRERLVSIRDAMGKLVYPSGNSGKRKQEIVSSGDVLEGESTKLPDGGPSELPNVLGDEAHLKHRRGVDTKVDADQ